MNKYLVISVWIIVIIIISFLLSLNETVSDESITQDTTKYGINRNVVTHTDTISKDNSYQLKINSLITAYPEFLNSADSNYLYWKDSTKMKLKTNHQNIEVSALSSIEFKRMLDSSDLYDQTSYCYPKGELKDPPKKNLDPGRFRYEPFFRKMYGNSKEEVRRNLTKISWLPNSVNKSLWVTKINNVNEKLIKISAELEKLPQKYLKYIDNPAGTFVWRIIDGTNRLSPHSFGIAIDINVNVSNYWRWSKPGNDGLYEYKNQIPYEIVKIFEKYGFIWGGKWYHYDTMHFEYRPELFAIPCSCESNKPGHTGP